MQCIVKNVADDALQFDTLRQCVSLRHWPKN